MCPVQDKNFSLILPFTLHTFLVAMKDNLSHCLGGVASAAGSCSQTGFIVRFSGSSSKELL